MREANANQIDSPCIGQCCLDQADKCVGCFRLLDEILVWGQASNAQKRVILQRCVERKQQLNMQTQATQQ